jgi:hypothetical protein
MITSPGGGEHVVAIQETPPPILYPHHPPKVTEETTECVVAVVEQAKTTTAKLNGYDGTPMDNINAVTSSDLCGTILGYVDKVVQFGDVVSQVILPLLSIPVISHHLQRVSRFIHMRSWHGKY